MSGDMDRGGNAPESAGRALDEAGRPHRKRLLVVLSVLAGTAIAAAWWIASPSQPAATGDAAAAVRTHATASTPAVPAASAATHPSPVPTAQAASAVARAADDAASAARRLAELRTAHDEIAERCQVTERQLERLEAELAQLRDQVATLESLAAARVQTHGAPSRRRSAPPTDAAQPATPSPRVLAVDIWNGRPSVALLVDGEVRFVAEGDAVAGARVRKADPASQRVEFVGGSGAPFVATAVEGPAR